MAPAITALSRFSPVLIFAILSLAWTLPRAESAARAPASVASEEMLAGIMDQLDGLDGVLGGGASSCNSWGFGCAGAIGTQITEGAKFIGPNSRGSTFIRP